MLLLTVGTAVLITAVLLRYAIIPELNSLSDNIHQYTTVNELISSEAGFSKIVDQIKKKNNAVQKKLLSLIGNTSENAHDLSGFLETLINKANSSDIRFIKIEPLAETQNQDFKISPIVLNFTSTYNALGQFVSSVENIPQMYKVDRLFLEAKSDGKVGVKMMVTCFIPVQEKL